MMLKSRSTTDGMMPARSGASTVDGRDGYMPIMIGITISMLIFCDMSTTFGMHGSHNSWTYVSHIRMHLYIEVHIVAINLMHKITL